MSKNNLLKSGTQGLNRQKSLQAMATDFLKEAKKQNLKPVKKVVLAYEKEQRQKKVAERERKTFKRELIRQFLREEAEGINLDRCANPTSKNS